MSLRHLPFIINLYNSDPPYPLDHSLPLFQLILCEHDL